RAANKFFNDAAPWKTLTDNPAQCARTLFTCVQVLRAIGIALAPVTPNLSESIQRLCGITQPITGKANDGQAGDNVWSTIPLPLVEQGTPTGPPQRLIEPIPDATIAAQKAKLGVQQETTSAATDTHKDEPSTPQITIEEFGRIALRTARVIAAERIPKSQKLLRLVVDLGDEQRQIVAGIGKHYAPEELIGLDVVVVANLKPARLMGVESHGMLLAANSGEQLVLVSPRGPIPPGSVVK
ncbi:MAG: methionine--tRNA ligase subunit beta, partial [Candidatus Kapabacteria bacterium]|nr:methionine--tRNA ligase subunit beta [Candidatus Kapabacteria bacterium]